MNDTIYVILFNGWPHRKDSAIRTYKTRERAEKEALELGRYPYYRDIKIEVGVFAVMDVIPVDVPPFEDRPIPYARLAEVSAE